MSKNELLFKGNDLAQQELLPYLYEEKPFTGSREELFELRKMVSSSMKRIATQEKVSFQFGHATLWFDSIEE